MRMKRSLYNRPLLLSAVILLCLLSVRAFSQDLDYPDYRNKRDNFKKVQQKDIRADLASFTMAGIDESISKLSLEKIPISRYGRDFLEFEGQGIRVKVTVGPFDPAKHKLQKFEDHLVKIDGKGFVGHYGSTPTSSITGVTVWMGKDSIALPPVAYADLHDLQFGYVADGEMRSTDAVYLSADHRKIYIYLLSKDEKEGYEVTWVIQDKQYFRRVLDFDLFRF